MAGVRTVSRRPEVAAALIEMDDGVRLATWATGSGSDDSSAVVLVHGGPGLPDYLPDGGDRGRPVSRPSL